MSTAAVSTSSINNGLQTYFQARQADLQKLGQALQSGDLTGAKQEISAIQTLGQSGPFANGDPFKISQREQAFTAVSQALQSGDLAGAQKAFAQLKSTFHQSPAPVPSPSPEPSPAVTVNLSGASPAATASASSSDAQPTAASSTASPSGPEIILNLGNVTPGEQITIGISNASNGTEQLTIGVAQQNQSPEQITLNLNQNSSQQIIVNLFNSTDVSAAQGSNVSVTA
jgi:hypothetical protein